MRGAARDAGLYRARERAILWPRAIAFRHPMPVEPIAGPPPGLKRIAADFGGIYAGNAIAAFLFAASGPVAIVLAVGARGGLAEADIASWIFAVFFVNGLITIAFSLLYRQPLVFFWTIPGTVLVGPAL